MSTCSHVFSRLPTPRLLLRLPFFAAWEKALPDLVDFMESLKSRRLASEKTRVFEARLQLFAEVLNESYHGGIGQPSALDIALGMPEVRAAIDVPVDVSLPKTAFAFLQHGPALAEFTARWRHAQAAALAAIVAAHTGPLDPATDPLSLAVARFACARCPAHAPYPQILAHRCPEYILARERVNTPDMYVRAALGALAACPRAAPQHVRLSHADETARVVRMCALDPARATVAAMNALPVRVGCRACSPVHGVAVMTWAGAVSLSRRVGRLVLTGAFDRSVTAISSSARRAGCTSCQRLKRRSLGNWSAVSSRELSRAWRRGMPRIMCRRCTCYRTSGGRTCLR